MLFESFKHVSMYVHDRYRTSQRLCHFCIHEYAQMVIHNANIAQIVKLEHLLRKYRI